MVARPIPGQHRILIVIGLQDWSGDRPPTSDDLAGRAVFHQAISGWQTITQNDGVILGERPLDRDRLAPMPMTGRVGEITTVTGWMAFKWQAEELFGSRESWIDAARRYRGSAETHPGVPRDIRWGRARSMIRE
jgi:hypothetical protein